MQKAIVQLHIVVWVEELVVLVDGALVVVIVGVLVVGVLQAVLVVSALQAVVDRGGGARRGLRRKFFFSLFA